MNKVLLDTNALLDVAVPSRPGSREALGVLGRIDEGLDCGAVSAGSLKDFYYVMTKYASEEAARGFVWLFMAILEVLPVDAGICACALDCGEPDFEDGIIRAIAENNGVDFIVTRDDAAFGRSRVRSLSPEVYLEIMGQPKDAYAVECFEDGNEEAGGGEAI